HKIAGVYLAVNIAFDLLDLVQIQSNLPSQRRYFHKIQSLYSLDKIMAGDMSELIAALKDYDRQQRLKNL
ncbi:unnamed protein product, partial [marine sediment metagenome]